jgi:hypothetical protein
VGLQVSSQRPIRRSLLLAVALIVAAFGVASPAAVHPALASTIGNTDYFNDSYNDGVASTVNLMIWGGVPELVNQRYGCTAYPYEPRTGAAHGCPTGILYWHSGIDINMPGGHQHWYTPVDGLVVDTHRPIATYWVGGG